MVKLFDVFVYGTLLTGESNHQIAKPYIRSTENGRVKGYLYDVGSYPALLLDQNGMSIFGEWFSVTREGLKQMDLLEEYVKNRTHNEYERVRVRDIDAAREGFVYVYSIEQVKHLPLIESGSWRKYRQK